ncbi:MAG TPA: EAL domain-containing protein [Noviherbaspirillum sp.]|jgi:diguanylate cyclase (GGDEF)-like protein/PAS domain S-box-containing protein|uniref:bifunctional diguanylate cyclase/phosphodiesterase n=1 Tax=Noviherbaspirillum sp. TaxID=1926288 RepID=UPI002F95DB2D
MFLQRQSNPLSFSALLVLGFGLACSVLLFIGVRHLEHDKADQAFRALARTRFLTLQQQLQDTEQVLKVLNQLFVTVEPVTRVQFREFTRPLVARHPYLQAFNFHRFVDGSEREAYENALRAEYPGFVLKELREGGTVPAVRRDRHLIVEYIEPEKGNTAAFGLDVSSNPSQMETLQRAIDTGRPASTPPLALAQGDGKRLGFLLLMPVYRHGMPLNTVSQRRAAAIGDTAAVFDAPALIGNILAGNGLLENAGIDIAVYGGAAATGDALVFQTGPGERVDRGLHFLLDWPWRRAAERLEHGFEVAGRPWRVVATPAAGFYRHEHGRSLGVLFGGLLFTLLVAAYVQSLCSRTRRVHLLVEQRTAELRLANDMLVSDIVARRKVEEALQLRQRAIEASANAIIITSAEGPHYPIQYVNPAFERITGYAAADILGRSCGLLWQEDRDQPEVHELILAAREKREAHVILRTYARDGRMFWSEAFISPVRDDTGETTHFVAAMYDITATRRYQAELEFQANRDTLTGLANRSLLHDRLRQSIAHSQRQGCPAWLLFLNLDRFKFVNDTLGHRAGDQLLRIVAERLQAAVRDGDTVARVSADEFMLLLPEGGEQRSPAIVQQVMEAVAQPIVIDGYRFVMGASVGVAVCPDDGLEPDTLIKHAGIAMYRAKESGRNNFQFYTPAMNAHAMERLRIEGALREALHRDEFTLHYQPQVDLASGRVVGMEALIRWRHPELGMIAPGRFIQLAEEMGLIVPIGNWVLRTACRQSVAWQRQGLGAVRVAVNLSARQFYQDDLVATIQDVFAETGIAPHLLELELTESMMMNDVEQAVDMLQRLKQLGVQLSIDDFGTGYSSLAYLKRFPIDLLKIDQSFVRDITLDPDDAAIVLSVISLAHSLRLQVIAEGVETAEQLHYLHEHGCDYLQGYFFSPPLAAAEAGLLLRSGKHLRLPGTATPRATAAEGLQSAG